MVHNFVETFSHDFEQERPVQSQHLKDIQREKEELAKYKRFFKRKRINPQILYNTLTFITPLFHHREEDWEEFLRLIIKEIMHRRPYYSNIQYWFLDKFQLSLNLSEAKYLCRYVKMSSIADDSETRLRDSMDNIDLPPMKYDNWVNAMYTLEGDDELDDVNFQRKVQQAHESLRPPDNKQNYFQFAFTKVANVVGNICPKEWFPFHKTYPAHRLRLPPSDNDDEKLQLSNRGARRSRIRSSDPSISFVQRVSERSMMSIENTLEREGSESNYISSFRSQASTATEEDKGDDIVRLSRRYRLKDCRVASVCEDAE